MGNWNPCIQREPTFLTICRNSLVSLCYPNPVLLLTQLVQHHLTTLHCPHSNGFRIFQLKTICPMQCLVCRHSFDIVIWPTDIWSSQRLLVKWRGQSFDLVIWPTDIWLTQRLSVEWRGQSFDLIIWPTDIWSSQKMSSKWRGQSYDGKLNISSDKWFLTERCGTHSKHELNKNRGLHYKTVYGVK